MYVLNIFKNLTKINDVLFVYFCGRLHERINNIPGGVPIKWRILSQTGKIGSGKSTKILFFLLGLKYTLKEDMF